MSLWGAKPRWLTFDCYGTLIQWDEGLLAAVADILRRGGRGDVDPHKVLLAYDAIEHELEQTPPFRKFRDIVGESLKSAMAEVDVEIGPAEVGFLTDRIAAMSPFPETVPTLKELKRAGYRLCIVSNTEDSVIAGNVAQLGGTIDRVVTAEQAKAYKPDEALFRHAWRSIGARPEEVVHICASPRLDLAAARELGFRCVWIDRGTGREPLPDYAPDAVLSDLAGVPELFAEAGWD
ncbi:haloacid dehalogenase type II [Afifella sp. IM 167]|uniref:haloacid dehalogenase type II n=1 Tax=Afifella sp. IM 167 TaxID=2033586 RepID=UPI001CCA94FD|nr:haloacid dehalogenase type II [Afifella sp. IM 167]MBZ8134054.1 haloacid dehalogenase type II [Afifella sp. IM 167]